MLGWALLQFIFLPFSVWANVFYFSNGFAIKVFVNFGARVFKRGSDCPEWMFGFSIR